MHGEFKILEKTVDDIKDYANNRIDQLKLGSAELVSDLVSVVIAKSLVALVFLLSLVFGRTALAYGIGDYVNRTWLGFFDRCRYLFTGGMDDMDDQGKDYSDACYECYSYSFV